MHTGALQAYNIVSITLVQIKDIAFIISEWSSSQFNGAMVKIFTQKSILEYDRRPQHLIPVIFV